MLLYSVCIEICFSTTLQLVYTYLLLTDLWIQVLEKYQIYGDSELGKYGPNKPNIRQIVKVGKLCSAACFQLASYRYNTLYSTGELIFAC